eukprot:TRINITY_DN12426_c0_g1_i3.p1 TRINITY_DN12426_c0_g1~~TRINITY_DN12426_c0_g1_i3.p1  ORF type:complete len:441 (+),score=52.19 TRINITY_DN12426_c0_g1_i3:59-1324(+)
MDLPSMGRIDFKLVVLPSALASGLFGLVRFPGLTDESAVMFRLCAAAVCICNMLNYWTSGATSHSSTFARLALVFHACTCFLDAQGSLFNVVLWFAHAGLEISYTWLYHCIAVPRKSPLLQISFVVVCLSCGGVLRLMRSAQPVALAAQARRLEERGDQQDTYNAAMIIITMVGVVTGGLMIYGVCSLDKVSDDPTLYYMMDLLKRVCASIWRRMLSCVDALRQSQVEVYEKDDSGVSEETDPVRFARDLFSTVAGTCRKQENLPENGSVAKVAKMIRAAAKEKVRSQHDSGELDIPNMTDPVLHDALAAIVGSGTAEDQIVANFEDIILNIVEADVIDNSSVALPNADFVFHVPSVETSPLCCEYKNLDHAFEGNARLLETSVDDAQTCDPLASLEELQQDAMCDCLMYSDSENGEDGAM